jgi:hypothetical protein
MNQIENKPDTAAMLSTLAGIIRKFNVSVDQYLHNICEPMQGSFWERMGIHRMALDPLGRKPAFPDQSYGSKELGGIFSSCRIIEFANWAEVDNASGLWDGLYTDVIKPLKTRDFQFIFHLGDITKRLVFEVDEILDIVGDYSSHGRVTLMLDDYEADKLWSRLNGVLTSDFRPQEAKEKYRFLFNTMNIDVLLILHSNRAELFSRDWQFDLAGRSLVGIREPNARVRFSVGYQLGLLLQLEIPHCIALGLIVSEVYTDQASGPGSKLLLDYMHDWMAVLLSNVHENTYL